MPPRRSRPAGRRRHRRWRPQWPATAFTVAVAVMCATWLFGFALRATLWGVEDEVVRRSGIRRVLTKGPEDLVETTMLLALASAAYLVCLWALRRGFRHSFAAAIAGCVLAGASIMPGVPLTSPDAVHLAADVRTLWVHGRYPGLAANAPAKVDDPVAQQVTVFKDSVSGYGPLAYAIGGAALPVSGSSLRAGLAGQKAIAGAFLVLAALFAGLVARELGRDPALAAGAVGLNPLMLWEFPGDGHNDVIMAAFGLAALLFLLRTGWRSRVAGSALGAAAVLTKFGLLISAPVVAASWFPRLRALFAALVMVGTGGIAAVYLAGIGPDVGAAGPARAVVATTPWGVLASWADASDGQRDLLVSLAYAGFGATLALITWRHPLRTGSDLVTAIALANWLFLFAWSPGLLPWYQVWHFPFAVLSGKRWLVAAALVFSIGGFLPILALNWSFDITRRMGFDQPVDRAVIVLWVATAATALALFQADRSRERRMVTPRRGRRPRRA